MSMMEIGKTIEVLIINKFTAHGKGKYYHADGAIYEGDWIEDR